MSLNDNPLLKRQAAKANKSKAYLRAPKQEKALAKRAKAWRISGSGSGKIKGDVQASGVARVECKCTQHKSFSVTQEMLDKIENAAIGSGEIPIIHIEFLDKAGKPIREVAVIPMYALERLMTDAVDP